MSNESVTKDMFMFQSYALSNCVSVKLSRAIVTFTREF